MIYSWRLIIIDVLNGHRQKRNLLSLKYEQSNENNEEINDFLLDLTLVLNYPYF